MPLKTIPYVIDDFGGGVIADNNIRKVNELMDAKNVVLDAKGGFEKRKGTELLTAIGTGINSESDIWGYVLYSWNGETGGDVGTLTNFATILEKTEGSMTNLIWVDFGTDNYAAVEAYYDAWVAAATTGSYNTNYNYDKDLSITGRVTSATIASGSLSAVLYAEQSDFGSAAAITAATDKEMTTAELDLLTYCIMGRWEQVGEKAGVSGIEDTYDITAEDKMNSLVELQRRDTTTNVRSRILMATYYDDDYGHLVKLTTTGDTLVITATTSLHSTLWADGKPDWAVGQNRAFMVNGIGDGVGTPNKIWTDGTNVRQIGLTAPTAATSDGAASDGGGALGAGSYQIAYTYKRTSDYGAESNQSAAETVVVTDGDSGVDDKITATVKYSADAQCDKIYKYRTLVGGSVFYYESSIANVVGTGTVATTWGTLSDGTIGIASLMASNSGLGNDRDRPPDANFLCLAADRMFYAVDSKVYYSKQNELEHVPSTNYRTIDEDDGEAITNISAFGRYIIIQKLTKTFLLDATYPDQVKPYQISNNIGCIAKRTFAITSNGKEAIWLSQEGFYKTNGADLQSLTVNRIYRNLMKHVDRTNLAAAEALYHPESMNYYCYIPYLNDQYRIWVYSMAGDNWVKHTYDNFRPHSMALWSDESNIKRYIIGCFIKGVELGRRSYFGHFVQADKDAHYKDVSLVSTCSSQSVTYTNIPMTVITGWDNIGMQHVEKQYDSIDVDWLADSATTATVTVYADYGTVNSGGDEITHAGIQGTPAVSDWQHGYDYIPGIDYQIDEYDVTGISEGTSNEVNGTNFAVKFYETSQIYVRVYQYTMKLKADPQAIRKE